MDLLQPLPPQITFNARGFTPDTRISVFDTEFIVHSMILKMHSQFFFQFLDSYEKEVVDEEVKCGDLGSGMYKYKYELVTRVEEGKWSLVAERDSVQEGEEGAVLDPSLDKTVQTKAFHKLLCAMYYEDYEVNTLGELRSLAEMADYYGAEPIVSKTLAAAIRRSQYRCRSSISIKHDATTLILIAAKLRHAEIFRDCVVILAGNWKHRVPYNGDLRSLGGEIHALIEKAYSGICQKYVWTHEKLMKLRFQNRKFAAAYDTRERERWDTSSPQFYFNLCCGDYGSINAQVFDAISGLLENRLRIFGYGYGGPGDFKGIFEDYFLCAEVRDEDLPWDVTESSS